MNARPQTPGSQQQYPEGDSNRFQALLLVLTPLQKGKDLQVKQEAIHERPGANTILHFTCTGDSAAVEMVEMAEALMR